MSDTLRYDAFISYRHQQPDKAWADWLARALETYSLPRTLRKSLSERGLRSRVARVFRDEDETSAGGDLSQQLKTALEQSGTLIVICSRNTPTSIWVNQEIEYFKSLGRAARVLPLLIDGSPAESFPPALCDQTSARIAVVATDVEPLAADVRSVPGISGREIKRRALLKLVAGALDVRYDDLYQRDRQRRRQQLLIRVSGLSGAIAIASFAYVGMADGDYPIPGGEGIRNILDGNGLSRFRPIPELQRIADNARPHRIALVEALLRSRSSTRLFSSQMGTDVSETWTTTQILASLARAPELAAANTGILTDTFAKMFSEDVLVKFDGIPAGWVFKSTVWPQGEIAAWMLTALGQTMARRDVSKSEEQVLRDYASRTLRFFERHRGTGGWAMYPSPRNVEHQNFYTSVLALQGLLHLSGAGVYVDDDRMQHRAMIVSTAQWLIDGFDATANPPGWKRHPGDSQQDTIDGLSLQIFSQLLRAEVTTGVSIPKPLSAAMTKTLISCVYRDLDFPQAGAEFWSIVEADGKTIDLQEAITFGWHPWAIESGAWWLAGAQHKGATPLEINRVARALGHLVDDLGTEAVREYSAGGNTYPAAELLYSLASLELLSDSGFQK